MNTYKVGPDPDDAKSFAVLTNDGELWSGPYDTAVEAEQQIVELMIEPIARSNPMIMRMAVAMASFDAAQHDMVMKDFDSIDNPGHYLRMALSVFNSLKSQSDSSVNVFEKQYGDEKVVVIVASM